MVFTAGLLSCFNLASICFSTNDDGFASTLNVMIHNAKNTQRNKIVAFASLISLFFFLSAYVLTYTNLQLKLAFLWSLNINHSFIHAFITKLFFWLLYLSTYIFFIIKISYIHVYLFFELNIFLSLQILIFKIKIHHLFQIF